MGHTLVHSVIICNLYLQIAETKPVIFSMLNYYFKDTIEGFLKKSTEEILGTITLSNQFDSTLFQNTSWKEQIEILQKALAPYKGTVFFEFTIPRMGKRVDAIVITENVVFCY